MRPLRRLAHVFAPLWLLATAVVARAQDAPADTAEDLDDPKLARRLGARVDLGPARGADGDTAPAGAARVEDLGAAPAAASPVEALPAAPGPERGARAADGPRTPRLKLGYRRFTFAQVGATAGSGAGADEPFDVVSLDFYPVSSMFRLGLSTQYGWQEGTFRKGGDAFIAESVSLGAQLPGAATVPFVEGYAGGGYMQRTHAGLNSVATVLGQLGVEAGLELFLARHLCLSVAVGYIHPWNGFVKSATYGSFSADAWSFKLGVGL